MLPLVAKAEASDANLETYITRFLPLIMKLDKMRDLEVKSRMGSAIKVKKYETLISQVWSLIPSFCCQSSPKMHECVVQLLKFMEPMI